MKVLIETDVELYPATTLLFGDEIRFPSVPQGCDQSNCGLEVPGDVAERWRAARDAWRQVQAEAEAHLLMKADAAAVADDDIDDE